MAKSTIRLIKAIRKAAKNIEQGSVYMWGHMGSCNCGHLAQELTHLSKKEIHERALERMGDWNEQCNDFCPTSGLAMDDLIQTMLNAGLAIEDLKNLENLSDKTVLHQLPPDHLPLRKNNKNDVVLYMKKWSDLLENKLLENIEIPEVHSMISKPVKI